MAFDLGFFPWINAAIQSPLFQFGQARRAGNQQQIAQEKADVANEARYGQGLQVLSDALQGGMNVYDAGNQKALNTLQSLQSVVPGAYAGRYQNFMGGFNQAAGQTLGGYGDRYRFAEDQLRDYGQQASADVDRYFEEERARTQQDLLNRGLLSSTEAANQFAGVTERQSAEQRRLAEDLMRNRVNILGGFRGEELGARERYDMARAGYDAALSGEPIQAAERWGGAMADFQGTTAANRANMFTGGMGNIANWIGARNDLPPPPQQLSQIFGQNAVDPPSAPGFQAESLIGPAVGATGGIIGAGILSGGGAGLAGLKMLFLCIDAESKIETNHGPARLAHVHVGDVVLGGDGEYHEVIGRDMGLTHAERDNDFVAINLSNGSVLCLTKDHVVGGQVASDWNVGDDMEITGGERERIASITQVPAPSYSGDLLLDGCNTYVANGMIVQSLLTKG